MSDNDKPDEWKAPASQDELNRIIADRLSRQREKIEGEFAAKFADYDDLKAKAEQLVEIENSKKDDLQKAIERAEAAEAAIAERDAADAKRKADADAAEALEKLRAEIAKEKGIEDPSILAGGTREALEAHAEKLKPLIKPSLVVPDQDKTPDNEPSEERAFVRGLFGGNE